MLTHFHGNCDTADIVDGFVYRMGYAFENDESAPLVAQMVRNPPAMWETWLQSLGWEDPLEKRKVTLPYSGLENFTDCVVHGAAKSWTLLCNFQYI